jgi:hypothetical protein
MNRNILPCSTSNNNNPDSSGVYPTNTSTIVITDRKRNSMPDTIMITRFMASTSKKRAATKVNAIIIFSLLVTNRRPLGSTKTDLKVTGNR